MLKSLEQRGLVGRYTAIIHTNYCTSATANANELNSCFTMEVGMKTFLCSCYFGFFPLSGTRSFLCCVSHGPCSCLWFPLRPLQQPMVLSSQVNITKNKENSFSNDCPSKECPKIEQVIRVITCRRCTSLWWRTPWQFTEPSPCRSSSWKPFHPTESVRFLPHILYMHTMYAYIQQMLTTVDLNSQM